MSPVIRKIARLLFPKKLWVKLRSLDRTKKIRKLEEICLREMVATALMPAKPEQKFETKSGAPLRRILLIADVMWETNELVPDLERICQVVVHDVRPMIRGKSPKESQECIVRSMASFVQQASHQEPDLILLYLRGNLLSDELFALMRKTWSCPLFGLSLDDKAHFWNYGEAGGGDHFQAWAKFFDVNLTNSKIAADWYRQSGATALYLAPAMKTPLGLEAPARADFTHFFTFVGSPKLDREVVVNRLLAAQMPIEVFGKGWQGGRWVEDPVQIYRSSQLNLGLGMATPNFSTTKNRDFECPGVGACYLTTFNWELAEWWDIGKEILCYRNVEELIEMACYYRHRPEACHHIALAAWRRGNAEHTWEIRFRKLFQELGFKI